MLICFLYLFIFQSMAKIAINIATGSLQQQEMVVGIDLGTTYSCVFAVQPNGDLELVETPEGNELTPSVVHFSGSAVSVGADAKKQMADDPDNVVVGIKRYMGKDYPQEYTEHVKKFVGKYIR